MKMPYKVLLKATLVCFASSALVVQAGYTPDEEAVVVRCNQSRKIVRDLWVSDAIEVEPAKRSAKDSTSLSELWKAFNQTRRAANLLEENVHELQSAIIECDMDCWPVASINPADPGVCHDDEDADKVQEMIDQRQRQKGNATEMADALEASFEALCPQSPRECQAAKTSSNNRLSLEELEKFNSISKQVKVNNHREANGLKALSIAEDGIVGVVDQTNQIFDTIRGQTTVQQAPSGVDGGSSARTQSQRAPAPRAAANPASAGATSTSTDGEAGAASVADSDAAKAASVATTGSKANGLVATAALVKNQYDAKKESKKQKAATAALRAAALAEAAQSESLNAALRIQESDLKRLTSSRSGDGRTGVGRGGTNVSSSNGARSLASVSNVSSAPTPNSGDSANGASASSAPAASAQATLRGSGGGGGSSSGGRASRSSSGGGGGSDLDRYTQNRGFFAAAKKALGFGSKKKTEVNAEKAGQSSTTSGALEGQPVGATATAAISKHWNKVLRRVEEGPDRGVASVSGNARGITARNQSIFGSVCDRYSAFRKDTGLKIGRSVCPSAK